MRVGDRSRRLEFDAAAARYDGARLPIPMAVLDRLCGEAHLAAGHRVLEVGAGSGQLTVGLRARGLRVVALEPGPGLAHLLRARLGDDQDVDVRVELFEAHRAAPGTYDAVVSANAFHWIEPPGGYLRAGELVGPGRPLALVWTYVAFDARSSWLIETLAAVEPELAAMGAVEERLHAQLRAGRQDLESTEQFRDVRAWWHEEPTTMSIEQCVALVTTYAGPTVVPDERLAELIAAVSSAHPTQGPRSVTLRHHAYAQVATAAPTGR